MDSEADRQIDTKMISRWRDRQIDGWIDLKFKSQLVMYFTNKSQKKKKKTPAHTSLCLVIVTLPTVPLNFFFRNRLWERL